MIQRERDLFVGENLQLSNHKATTTNNYNAYDHDDEGDEDDDDDLFSCLYTYTHIFHPLFNLESATERNWKKRKTIFRLIN